jgi:hypothetical protein
MAADLAASYLVDFKIFFAPQVELELTTLRLTARHLHISGLLIFALQRAFLHVEKLIRSLLNVLHQGVPMHRLAQDRLQNHHLQPLKTNRVVQFSRIES